jgi:hypothetical protein
MNATTKTMKTTSNSIASRFWLPDWIAWIVLPIAGTRPTTMPAKMISEMPLPMPRSLICSPSHITNAVPVVSVSTVMARKSQPPSGTSEAPPCVCTFSRNSAMPVPWMIEINTVP